MRLSPSSLAFYSDEHCGALQIELGPAVRSPVLAEVPLGALWEPPRAESTFWAPRTSHTHGNPSWSKSLPTPRLEQAAPLPTGLWWSKLLAAVL